MTAAISECPASLELAAFFDRDLEERSEEIRAHIEGCDECLAALAFFLKGSRLGGSIDFTASASDIEPGTRVGPFELQTLLGAGNLGRVYQALDTRLERDIALKLLGTSCEHPDWTDRLVKEAQAMAKIRHPNVCTVYEVGRDGELVYIAMEKIDGETLRQRADGGQSEPELLEILSEAARGMFAAHTKGIVHRDFKPDNVMVESQHGKRRVVVCDFGLAAAGSAALPDEKLGSTKTVSELVGSPAYMAPEQFDATPVDHRADIFAFGVTAWELFNGRRPFEGTNLAELRESQRTPPVWPRESTVKGPIRELIKRCLSPNPSARPGDMAEIADELDRVAFDYGDTTRRATSRWPTWVALASVLAAAGVFAYFKLFRAQSTQPTATEVRLESNLDYMLGDLHQKLAALGKLELIGDVADEAAAYYATRPVDFSKPEEIRRRTMAFDNIGDVYLAKGKLDEGLARYRESLKLRRTLAGMQPKNPTFQRNLALSHEKVGKALRAKGDLPAAIASFRSALEIGKRLAANEPESLNRQRDLSVSYDKVGDVLTSAGKLPEAKEAAQASLDIRSRLVADKPEDDSWRRDLALSHYKLAGILARMGKLKESLEATKSALALNKQLVGKDPANTYWLRDTSQSYNRLSTLLLYSGDKKAALTSARASVSFAKKLVQIEPENTQWQRDLSISYDTVSGVLRKMGDDVGAIEAAQASLSVAETLAKTDPANTIWQRDLSLSYAMTGDLLRDSGKAAEATESYRKSVQVVRALVDKDPSNAEWQGDLGNVQSRLGKMLRKQGKLDEAFRLYKAALVRTRAIADKSPDDATLQNNLALSYERVGDVLKHQGKHDEAREHLQKYWQTMDALSTKHPDDARWQNELAGAHYTMGSLEKSQGDLEKAQQHFAECAAGYDRHGDSLNHFYNGACCYALTDKKGKAFALLTKAVEQGLSSPSELAQDEDLASLRGHPKWKVLMKQLAAK